MNTYHIYPYQTPDRDGLQLRLREAGVQTLCHYPIPIHKQRCFGTMFEQQDFAEAERLAAQELSLPISPVMTDEQAEYVCNIIRKQSENMPRQEVPFLPLELINARYETELNEAAQRVISRGWYVNGEETHAFEAEFASYCADKSGLMSLECVGCGNGLDALTLILLALKQKHGWTSENEVIVPAMTFIATAQAVQRAGLSLRLCDVTSEGLMDPMSAAMSISDKTVALLPVHLYGQLADMTTLSELAAIHNLEIVQDAAQGHGLPLDAGGATVIAAFSFYPGKNLGALGDGGAVVTSDPELAMSIRTLANYGACQKYQHNTPEAFNSRLDELQAALLRVKLRYLDEDNAHRAHIAAIYNEKL